MKNQKYQSKPMLCDYFNLHKKKLVTIFQIVPKSKNQNTSFGSLKKNSKPKNHQSWLYENPHRTNGFHERSTMNQQFYGFFEKELRMVVMTEF